MTEGVGTRRPLRRVHGPTRRRIGAGWRGAALAATVGLFAGCSGDAPESTPKSTDPFLFSDSTLPVVTESLTPPTAPDGTINLRAAGCPDPIAIEADGPPSLYQSAWFALMGGTRTSTAGRAYIDDLLDPNTGKTTGTQLELRFPDAASTDFGTRLSDPLVLGALASTEEQLVNAVRTPTVAVVVPWAQSARMLYWDPQTYPLTQSIPDLGMQKVKVRVRDRGIWLSYLVSAGLLSDDEVVVTSATDDLVTAFVADRGRVASEGSADRKSVV